jgi:hypothetical protein
MNFLPGLPLFWRGNEGEVKKMGYAITINYNINHSRLPGV